MIKEPVAQYIVDAKGKRTAVILEIAAHENLLDLLDDYYCSKAFDESKPIIDAEIAQGKFSTLDEYLASRKRKQAQKKKPRQ